MAEVEAGSARGQRLIEVSGVSKTYGRKRAQVFALRDVSLDIYRGEYLSIMGPSGSGKSTLFNVVGALDRPSAGTVRIGSLDLTALPSRQLAYVRCHHLGYVFQAYNLIASLSALENVALPRIFLGASGEEAEAAARRRLEQVGLGHRLDHRPSELSGGQQQRVAIARALVNDPSIILADEPTANLDLKTGAEVISILKSLSVTDGVTIVTATHDHKMLKNSDRVVHIRDGQIEKIERSDEIEVAEGQIVIGGHAVQE
ncbi:MAG TPA: ABC transporter ATP-binding protein [Polyangiaceae bacterium]|jgi:putative ABC transport system ATP-binding protein|nr:ABC transporter ATP-binding protein [Polyangiaceae bacterium]